MKKFKDRLKDYDFYCDKLHIHLKSSNLERVSFFIDKIKETGLDLKFSNIDFLSAYLLNNKKYEVYFVMMLLSVNAKINSFHLSIIKNKATDITDISEDFEKISIIYDVIKSKIPQK